eukprot:TRINITY_DN6264_c0_g1_i1.p1 TRINITY_DN6264_c0_g1~~TRINITY_DN6264_c0_g1_i1.p1  ORF type:complete len:210 (+),score=42.23 TRINITY_DN6264_c0_g1_i1:249-878(+)
MEPQKVDEDEGIYIICFVCDQLERWDKHVPSGEPVFVTQKRVGDTEQYFRLANVDRTFRRMLISGIAKGFGKASAEAWLSNVVLIWNYRTPNPVIVSPDSTPYDLRLTPNRKLDIPYKLTILPQPVLPMGVLIPPASVLRRRKLTVEDPTDADIVPWSNDEPTAPEEQQEQAQQEAPLAESPPNLLLGSPVEAPAAAPVSMDGLDDLLM